MQNIFFSFLKRSWLLLVSGVLLLAGLYINWPVWQAHAFFNHAQLAHLQGDTDVSLYERALALTPENDQMRWQMATALVALEQPEAAAELLQPFIHYHELDQQVANFLLNTLVAGRRDNDAAHVYQNLTSPPPFPPPSRPISSVAHCNNQHNNRRRCHRK